MGDQKKITVSSLLCSSHVEMAANCLASIQRLHVGGDGSVDGVGFRIHDDGSLTTADHDQLLSALGGSDRIEFVSRQEADQRMADRLRAFPALLKLREYFPLALKLLDAPLWNEDDPEFRFVDGDILLLRPVRAPFTLPANTDAVFMADRESNYSLRSWQLLISAGLRLPAQANSGVIAFRRSAYDVDFLNWFVGRKIHHAIPWVVEQTAWAALGFRAAGACQVFDPERVRVMRENEDDSALVMGHFTARTRHLLPGFVARSQKTDADPETTISLATRPVEACRYYDLLSYEARRLSHRFGGKTSAADSAKTLPIATHPASGS